jgi:cold shock CspA family protein
MSHHFVKGGLKIFSYEKGWGWIRVEGREADLFFHVSQYLDSDELKPGTRLVFEIGPGSTGREQAASWNVFSQGFCQFVLKSSCRTKL